MRPLFTFTLFFLFSFQVSSQLPPESDPLRGMYIDKFMKPYQGNSSVIDPNFSILSVDTNCDGIFEKEDAYLEYACENHITYLALYDLSRILNNSIFAWNENTKQFEDLEKHLCRFIEKAKTQYGITQIGAVGGGVSLFDSIYTFMDRFPVTEPYRLRNETVSSEHFNSKLRIVENDNLVNEEEQLSELYKLGLRINDFNSCECQADIDVLNIEYEFWGDCINDLPNFIDIMNTIYSIKQLYNTDHPDNPLITEAYIAFLNSCTNPGMLVTAQVIDGCDNCSPFPGLSNPHPRMIDRVLYTMTIQSPSWFYFSDINMFENIHTEDTSDIHPMFYSESQNTGGVYDFLGPWLAGAPQNTIFFAEEYFYYHWLNSSASALGQPQMNDIQPGGVHWFTGSHMVGHLSDPQMVITPEPFCSINDSAKIILNYYGPDEPGTDYTFSITRDSDNAIVYPIGGGSFNGVSQWTVNDPGYRSINFADTSIFPELYLPEGSYTTHLELKYNHSTGCTYSCDYTFIVDDRARLQISGDSAFCNGGYTFLTTNIGASSYVWHRNGKPFNHNSNILKVTEDGDYYCVLTGGNCPSTTDTIHITVHPLPNAEVNAKCNSNGTITLKTNTLPASQTSNETSGPGGVTYEWNTGETTDQITVNTPSTRTEYRVLITDPYSGCTLFRKLNIPNPLLNYTTTITINQLPSTTCSNDGIITASLNPAPTIYDPVRYLWSTGATFASISGLAPGTYSVAISNYKNACSSFGTIVLGNLPLNGPTLNEIITDSPCNNTNGGSIILAPSGGNPPFTYLWKNIPNENTYSPYSEDQFNLFPGIYDLTVSDVNGCEFAHSFTIESDNSTIEVEADNVIPVTGCSGLMNGSASLIITGGNSPYVEEWYNSAGSVFPDGSILSSGSYRVIVTDADGCTESLFVNIPTVNLPLSIHLHDSSKTTVSCNNVNDGSLYGCIEGGVEPFTINAAWNVDSNIFYMEDLFPGNYPIMITDANSCTIADTITVEQQTLNILATPEHTICIGCSNGQIHITYSGGLTPHSLSWLPLNGTLNNDTINSLPADTYIVCVIDSNSCQHCDTVIVLDNPMMIEEIKNETNITIYPNPSPGHFELKVQTLIDENLDVYIADVYGRMIFEEKIISNIPSQFNLSIAAGIYYVMVKNSKGVLSGSESMLISNTY
jgi:hypothetical protein